MPRLQEINIRNMCLCGSGCIYRCFYRMIVSSKQYIINRVQRSASRNIVACNGRFNFLHSHNICISITNMNILVISKLPYSPIDSYIDYFSFIREVFIYWAVQNNEVIGGEGKIVEIDEVLLLAVQNRTSETLMKIIEQKILPGTRVYSDCWRTYDYTRPTVNHSINIVDPKIVVHTQNIECLWVEVPRFGRRKEHHPGYLYEALFMMPYLSHTERLHVFLEKYSSVISTAIPFVPPSFPCNLPDAIATNCAKCSPAQVRIIRKTAPYIMKNRPQDWDKISIKFDPQRKYKDSFMKFLMGK